MILTPSSIFAKSPPVPNIDTPVNMNNIESFHVVNHILNFNNQQVNDKDLNISDEDNENLDKEGTTQEEETVRKLKIITTMIK